MVCCSMTILRYFAADHMQIILRDQMTIIERYLDYVDAAAFEKMSPAMREVNEGKHHRDGTCWDILHCDQVSVSGRPFRGDFLS
jgi:hypothetical protein